MRALARGIQARYARNRKIEPWFAESPPPRLLIDVEEVERVTLGRVWTRVVLQGARAEQFGGRSWVVPPQTRHSGRRRADNRAS